MILSGLVSSIMMHVVFLALCASTSSAPAHHLTIGVQGNTPTLFVTSSEIGITSETERSRLKTSKVQKELKSNEKSKYQKTKSNANYKKLKSIYFSKNLSAPPVPMDYSKANQTLDASLGGLAEITLNTDTPKFTHESGTTATTEQTSSATSQPFKSSIVTTTAPTDITVHDDSVKQIEKRVTKKEVILLDKMPPTTEGLTANPPTESVTETTGTTTSTVSPLTIAVTDAYIGGIATAGETGTTVAAIMQDKPDDIKYKLFDNREDVSLDVYVSTTVAGPDVWSTTRDTEINDGTETQTENIVETETPPPMPFPSQNTLVQMVATDSKQLPSTTESILKLIDLEKHNTEHFKSFSQHGEAPDNGHDGLKNIKKKQLVDRHFLEVSSNSKAEETRKEKTSNVIPTKHGFLGPILMEEKTIHVMHANSPEAKKIDQPTSVDIQLRHSNFIEIKPTTDDEQVTTSAATSPDVTVGQFVGVEDAVLRHDAANEESTVLSSTTFEVGETLASKNPPNATNTTITSTANGNQETIYENAKKSESKISDIQIEVYDSTIDSIVASTNFKDTPQGKTTKPPVPAAQQERFTQYVIDRTETSTQESINFSIIQVASGLPEPAAIEIHINVSESFSNDAEDLDVSFPQADYSNTGHVDDAYDDVKEKGDIKLKVPSNTANCPNKDRSDEILVVEIVDDNATDTKPKSKTPIDMILKHVRVPYSTPPPPPPPPPYQGNFDRDSDTIFYISNTEVKVGESPPTGNKALEERKMKLENQFFPANYMASTHPNVNTPDDHHLYEEDIILSSDRNQADSLKIYRNRNEPSPPLDVTYVGESIIEVEQSPDFGVTTTLVSDHMITPQPDVIIQPAILPEISIGVPVIGELPPQIELKEMDFMPNVAQLHRSGIYSNDDTNVLNGISGSSNVDNQLGDSSIQYGGDLIDESADGGFDGVEGSYPFGNPATLAQRKHNHVADYAHLYINYGVNNMRKDELSADIKDSGEVNVIVGNAAGSSTEQNITSKEFMNRVTLNNITSLNESERMSNVTAFSILEDPTEMDEKNTEDIINLISLAIGLFIVILPVVVTCSMLWALRYLYKKYHSTSTDSNGNLDPADGKGLPSEGCAEKGECEQVPCSPSRSDKDDIQKCPETFKNPTVDNSSVKFSAELPTHVDSSVALHCKMYSCSSKTRDCPILLPLNPTAGETQTIHDEILPGPNGSVTKMTLENNLLIVETEERNDISRVARETKMDYNKDGVFVVEVARGIDSRTIPESPVTDGPEKMLSMFEPKHNGNMAYKLANEKVSHNNEKVQIHSPPPEKADDGPRSLHQIEEVDEPGHSPRLCGDEEETVRLNYKSNTGLSQSDLSSTSSNDSNKDYCYGNQELYVVEQTGYCTSSPTANVPLKCDTKDIKDDDQNSESGPYLEHSPHKDEDTREAEDILDTINNKQPKTETFDEKHMVQGEKETEMDFEKGNGEIDTESTEDQVMCNGHLESNGINVDDASIESLAAETKDHSINDTSNSTNQSEELLESATSDNFYVNVSQDHIAIIDNKEEVVSDDKILEENKGTTDSTESIDVQTITYSENNKSYSKSLDIVAEEPSNQTEDPSESDIKNQVHLNGSQETPSDEQLRSEKDVEILNESLDKSVEHPSVNVDKSDETPNESSHLTNGSNILPDVVPSGKVSHLTNGDATCEVASICTTEFENGYDSIMSLPDPPTSEEIFCGDMSDHQMDSLPPPPPPMLNETSGDTFNLKDLPPPLTNCATECLPNEDITNYYATLPPPPPTTLDVSATTPTTNGNMHASPLTPPASPPPHFTSGLLAAMCTPIAVDVNGS